MKRKKVYFITVVIGFAICMVGVIFGSRLVFQRTCERRTTPWSDLGTADDDEYRILIDAYKIKNQSNETVMIQAFDNTKLIGHYYEREKGAPLIVFFHGLWGHSYLDGVPIYRITQKHNWNLLLCDLRAQGDSEGEFSTLGVLEKYDCLDWVEWAQNRFGDKNPMFLMGVSMGASIVMMSSDLELPDSVYGIIDDCGFTSTLDVIKQNNNKKISKYIPKNLLPTMLNVGTKIWGSFDLSDADACKALAHTDIPLLIIHGDEDMKAPLSMAYKLYDSCNGEKQLYIVHGADHSENYRKDPGGYEKIVTNFIEERLRQKKCQTPGTKLKTQNEQNMSFVLFGVLYASRCNNFHGNVAARMNSINANKDTFKMYTDMFLTEYIILAIHLNSQGALSDMVLNKVKENANLMV